MATLRDRVQFLQSDLNEAIKLGAWGGTASYVEIYNNLLTEAQKGKSDIPLKPAQAPKDYIPAGTSVSPVYYQVQEGAEKQAMLALKPLIGQLYLWTRAS